MYVIAFVTHRAGDGVLTEWEQWTPCSKSCGGFGSQTRERVCIEHHGNGTACEGDLSETQFCSRGECPLGRMFLCFLLLRRRGQVL